MTVGYASYAAPLATTASTLGVAPQPATTPTATGGGNAAVATGYSATPAASGGGTAQPTVPQALNTVAGTMAPAAIASAQTAISSLGAAPAPAPAASAVASNAHSTAASNFGGTMANDLATASGGGVISNALKSGVSSIVAFAQKGMADIQKAIQGDMAANNGEVDPAKMQLYTMKMSTYELLNNMAAKIQEKEDAAMQRWLR